MKKFRHHTVEKFLDILASKHPVPGGGSAAALTAATGAALISMAAHYSLGRGSSKKNELSIRGVLGCSERIRRRLIQLVDLDAEAYLKVVKARKDDARKKRAALVGAIRVPQEVGRLCYQAIQLTPDLVKKGNHHLLSDVEVAAELLLAAFKSAMINVAVNEK